MKKKMRRDKTEKRKVEPVVGRGGGGLFKKIIILMCCIMLCYVQCYRLLRL